MVKFDGALPGVWFRCTNLMRELWGWQNLGETGLILAVRTGRRACAAVSVDRRIVLSDPAPPYAQTAPCNSPPTSPGPPDSDLLLRQLRRQPVPQVKAVRHASTTANPLSIHGAQIASGTISVPVPEMPTPHASVRSFWQMASLTGLTDFFPETRHHL
jgi:hypothetical protein